MEKHVEKLTHIQCLELSAAFLAASELPSKEKDNAIDKATLFSRTLDQEEVWPDIVHRYSTRLRVQGKVSESDKVLNKVFKAEISQNGKQTPRLPLSHAQLGHVILSQALNFMQRECLDKAIEKLEMWEPSNPERPSRLEHVVFIKILTNRGKVLRWQGDFTKSHECLKEALQKTEADDMSKDLRTEVVCNLGDTLIELSRFKEAQELLDKEYDFLKKSGRANSKVSRTLQLSLAETYMQQWNVTEAEHYYEELSGKFEKDKFARLRWTIGVARVAHVRSDWKLAQKRWQNALNLAYTDLELGDMNNPYTHVTISKSLRQVILKSSPDYTADQPYLQNLVSSCRRKGCKNWIPGFNSHWLAAVEKL